MSHLGKKPLPIPEGVSVSIGDDVFEARGPKGTLSVRVHPDIVVAAEGGSVTVQPRAGREGVRGARAQWGTVWALVRNTLAGVASGFLKQLELQGVGYRAELAGRTVKLSLGFTHPVEVEAPEGITIRVEKNIITVEGADKARVGEVAASIRRLRPPEPYKGKGIRYLGEVVRRKAGKVAGGTTATG